MWLHLYDFINRPLQCLREPEASIVVAVSAAAPLVTLILQPDCGWLFSRSTTIFCIYVLQESLIGDCARHSWEHSLLFNKLLSSPLCQLRSKLIVLSFGSILICSQRFSLANECVQTHIHGSWPEKRIVACWYQNPSSLKYVYLALADHSWQWHLQLATTN